MRDDDRFIASMSRRSRSVYELHFAVSPRASAFDVQFSEQAAWVNWMLRVDRELVAYQVSSRPKSAESSPGVWMPVMLSQAHARPSAIFVDEFDATSF
jgi:hypothetical protein